MATQSEIGTWQQIAAWEKSISGERNIAPSPPKSKSVKRAEKTDEDSADDVRRPSLHP
jgi:hypothetical protein